MNERQTEPAYRAISTITLVMAGVIVAGTMFVTVMCKLRGYDGGIVPDAFFRPDALVVRRSGWLLLLVPFFWAAAALFASRSEFHPWFQRALLGLGLAFIQFGIYGYLLLGFNPTIL